jgi:hypothetical protein
MDEDSKSVTGRNGIEVNDRQVLERYNELDM